MSNKFQNVNFKSIDDFLAYLPARELEIVEYLRLLITDCIPGCKEKLSYNVPYYSKKKRICFIWPAAVSWGGVKQQGVRLGFVCGYLMNDPLNYLDKGNRKQVYWRDFTSIKEIKEDVLKMYLFEAAEIDRSH